MRIYRVASGIDDQYLYLLDNEDISGAQSLVDSEANSKGFNIKLYHGTWSKDFNVFNEGSHFSEDELYAKRYENTGASSLGSGGGVKTRINPRTMGFWVKIENPFDTRDNKAKYIFNRKYYRIYGTGTELQESGLPDWNDGHDLMEFLQENYPEYDGVILDEGGEYGVSGEVVKRPISYIPLKQENIKSADVVTYDDNGEIIPLSMRFDSNSKDIRF